jgi:hypothetical protein
MEKALDKLEKILKLAGENSATELYEALEKILPESEENKSPKVKFKIGWAVGNEEDPGNHCSIFIKVDNL